MNAASGREWAKAGYGRRMVFLFVDALLILETNLAGKPNGVDPLELGDEAITTLPKHACALATRDSRNALIPISDVAAARLTGQRKYEIYCLELRTTNTNAREFTFYWRAKLTYRKVREDGALPIADRPEQAAVEDIHNVFRAVLVDETTWT